MRIKEREWRRVFGKAMQQSFVREIWEGWISGGASAGQLKIYLYFALGAGDFGRLLFTEPLEQALLFGKSAPKDWSQSDVVRLAKRVERVSTEIREIASLPLVSSLWKQLQPAVSSESLAEQVEKYSHMLRLVACAPKRDFFPDRRRIKSMCLALLCCYLEEKVRLIPFADVCTVFDALILASPQDTRLKSLGGKAKSHASDIGNHPTTEPALRARLWRFKKSNPDLYQQLRQLVHDHPDRISKHLQMILLSSIQR